MTRLSQNAYIRLVEGSATQSLTLEELKEQLQAYQDQVSNTGKQLDWNYAEAAFPYTIETTPDGEGKWFYLKGTNELYKHIVFGVDCDEDEENQRCFVQVVLPDNSTHGDKAKGNELCKYLGKRLKAELQLFNGRTMYYNPRK